MSLLDEDRLVHGIYDSLLDEGGFGQALSSIAEAFRSHVTGLHLEDFGSRSDLELTGTIGAEDYGHLLTDFSSRWSSRNLWMERSIDGFQRQGFQHDAAVATPAELHATDYYRQFLRPLDIEHGVGILVWDTDGAPSAVASLNRSRSAGPLREDEIALIARLRPHLVSAYSIYRRLARAEVTLTSFRLCFERAPLGMMVLDEQGCVLQSNRVAQQLLAQGGGVSMAAGARLRFASPLAAAEFAKALRDIRSKNSAPSNPSILVAPPVAAVGHSRIVMHLVATPLSAPSFDGASGRVLAFLHELDRIQDGALAESVLRNTLGLTRMEARICLGLRRCGSVDAVAATFGITENTVRSHLKFTFRKTGVHTQAGLARLVDRLVSWLPVSP